MADYGLIFRETTEGLREVVSVVIVLRVVKCLNASFKICYQLSSVRFNF